MSTPPSTDLQMSTISTTDLVQNPNANLNPNLNPKLKQQNNFTQKKRNVFKLPDPVDPVDIGIKILVEEDEDGITTRCFTEQKDRYYTNFAKVHELLAAQETPIVQMHFTYMQPLVSMSQDIFLSANINHMELDVTWDIEEASEYVIGFGFITQDNKLLLLSKSQTLLVFTATHENIELWAHRHKLIGCDWTTVLSPCHVLEDDISIVITKESLADILDKRNGAIRHTAVQPPVDLSSLLNEYTTASTMYHVSKIEKERQINSVIQKGQAQILDHTNIDGGWALVHSKQCIGQPKWDIKPYPKQDDWDDIEKRYKELRNKLRVAQIRQLDLMKYADETLLRQITPEYKYHVIFTGVLYNDPEPLTLKNLAIEHVKFIKTVLAQSNMGIGIANIDVSVSRLYDRLAYDKMSATDYYIQNPIIYGWHGQLSRVAKVHGLDLVSITSALSYNPTANEEKLSGSITINRCVRTTIFLVWFC
jgi:hypothetical protein